MISRHKVFISYYNEDDQLYRDEFEHLFAQVYDIMESRSVEEGDIDSATADEYTYQQIREKYLSDSTVTVVLIGPQTWSRKFVDWEIYFSLRSTQRSHRSGLLGIILPTYSGFKDNTYSPRTIPSRLYDNLPSEKNPNSFARIYKWNKDPNVVSNWIQEAYSRRDSINPINSRSRLDKNLPGSSW